MGFIGEGCLAFSKWCRYQFSEEGVLVGLMQEKSIKGKLLPIKNPPTRTIYQEE